MRPARTALAVSVASVALVLATRVALAQCPTGRTLEVDHDVPGSGYSETSDNWTTWNTTPCSGAGYRYLSHTVGDGTRRGKAIFRPPFDATGYWRFETAFRATENRTSDADYYAFHDGGAAVHRSVDQRGDGCTWVELGTFFCRVGGECRVELDGTDDSQSDGADVSRFTLVSCADGPDGGGGAGGSTGGGRCDALRQHAAFEVCEETATTCAGTFTDGSGCEAFCATAGMACTARFGGEPGCQKEPQNVIACDAANGHGSDYCECAGPPLPDAGGGGGRAGSPGAGGAAGIAGVSSGGGAAGALGADAGATADGSAAGAGAGAAGAPSRGATSAGDDGGCGCRTPARGERYGWLAGLGVVMIGVRRRKAVGSVKGVDQ